MNTDGISAADLGHGEEAKEKFNCPACKRTVLATEREAHFGVKCSHCGTGFVPQVAQARPAARREQEIPYWAWAMVAAIVLGGAVLVFYPGLAMVALWVAPALLVIGLLIGIFVRMGKMNRQR